MQDRKTLTISKLIDYIEENQEKTREVKEEKIDKNTTIRTVDGVRVYADEEGKYDMPPTDAQKLTNIADNLALDKSDDINKQSHLNESTLLIQATIFNELNLVVTLLNHGADPSISDSEGNNAIIHAAKLGRTAILKEYAGMIQIAEVKTEAKKENDADISSEPVGSNEKRIEPMQGASTQETKQQQPVEKHQRIVLSPEVLLKVNKAGETVEKLMESYKEKIKPEQDKKDNNKRQAPVRRKPEKKIQKNSRDPLTRFKALLDEIHNLSSKLPEAQLSMRNKAVGKTTKTKPNISDPVKSTYKDKLNRVRHQYDAFFNKKFFIFSKECKEITHYYINLEPAKKREEIRLSKVKEGDKTEPVLLLPTELPAHYEDQATVRTALALLKDYFAPESAPLSKSTGWNSLRRLLTFHTGRRYCKEAEELFNDLSKKPLASVDNIVAIYTIIDEKLDTIRKNSHDKKNNNSIFNSSYTRRLFYISEMLKKTESYKCRDAKLPDSVYIGSLDLQYRAKRLF